MTCSAPIYYKLSSYNDELNKYLATKLQKCIEYIKNGSNMKDLIDLAQELREDSFVLVILNSVKLHILRKFSIDRKICTNRYINLLDLVFEGIESNKEIEDLYSINIGSITPYLNKEGDIIGAYLADTKHTDLNFGGRYSKIKY